MSHAVNDSSNGSLKPSDSGSTLFLPKSKTLFLHCPKTGGKWISYTLQAIGVEIQRYGKDTIQDREWSKTFAPKPKHIFTIIRNPTTWFQSYFCDRLQNGWGGDLPIAHPPYAYPGVQFNAWMEAILKAHPLWLVDFYSRFVADDVYVGRTELLAESLCAILAHVGEKFNEDLLFDLKKQKINRASDYPGLREMAQYAPSTLEMLELTLDAFDNLPCKQLEPNG